MSRFRTRCCLLAILHGVDQEKSRIINSVVEGYSRSKGGLFPMFIFGGLLSFFCVMDVAYGVQKDVRDTSVMDINSRVLKLLYLSEEYLVR
jgi:hypothetical protein